MLFGLDGVEIGLIIVFFCHFGGILSGFPVAFAIGISGFLFFVQQSGLPFTMPAQLILSETQNFPLLAIPMFIFAGNLLNNTGITSRLMNLSSVLAGHMYGGLAQTSVVLSTLMGGVSGSAIADASMQSRILGPEMLRKGYSRGYSAGVNGFTALITVAIPPGIGLVLYGSIGEVSIGRLFAADIFLHQAHHRGRNVYLRSFRKLDDEKLVFLALALENFQAEIAAYAVGGVNDVIAVGKLKERIDRP